MFELQKKMQMQAQQDSQQMDLPEKHDANSLSGTAVNFGLEGTL
jgi:hypothetical protein